MLTALTNTLDGAMAAAAKQACDVLAAAAIDERRTVLLLGTSTGYRVTMHTVGEEEFGQGYYTDDEQKGAMRFAQLLGEAVV